MRDVTSSNAPDMKPSSLSISETITSCVGANILLALNVKPSRSSTSNMNDFLEDTTANVNHQPLPASETTPSVIGATTLLKIGEPSTKYSSIAISVTIEPPSLSYLVLFAI